MFMVLVINVCKKRPSVLCSDCTIANTVRDYGLDEVTPGWQARSGLRLVNPRNPEERISLQGEASILRVPCLIEWWWPWFLLGQGVTVTMFLTFFFVLAYSQLTLPWWFQANSRGTQPYIFIYPFSPKSHPSRLPHNTEWSSRGCALGPCWLSLLNTDPKLPNDPFLPSPPPATISLFSKSVSLFLFCKLICIISCLDFAYKQCHMISLLWLSSLVRQFLVSSMLLGPASFISATMWDLLAKVSTVNITAKKGELSCRQWAGSRPGKTVSLLQDAGCWESILLIQMTDLLLTFLRSHQAMFISIFLHGFSFILPVLYI